MSEIESLGRMSLDRKPFLFVILRNEDCCLSESVGMDTAHLLLLPVQVKLEFVQQGY